MKTLKSSFTIVPESPEQLAEFLTKVILSQLSSPCLSVFVTRKDDIVSVATHSIEVDTPAASERILPNPPLDATHANRMHPLKRIRERMGWSQKELARLLKRSMRTISRIETGHSTMRYTLLAIITLAGLPDNDPDAIALLKTSNKDGLPSK